MLLVAFQSYGQVYSTSLSGTSTASLRPSFFNSPGQSHSPIAPSSSQPQWPSLDAEYSSILLLNAQSVNPSAKSLCKWKLPYTSENFLHNIHTNIPILGISESWLKSYITDAQIHINFKDYVPIRSDRSIRKGGKDHFDDITCQASLCILQTIPTILINVYRPAKSSSKSFFNLLKHVQSYLDKHINVKHYDIIIY